jgi:hypothetical protein
LRAGRSESIDPKASQIEQTREIVRPSRYL